MRRMVAWKMGVGVVLAALFFGTLGGLLYLGYIVGKAEESGPVEAMVVVLRRDATPRFEGVLLVDPPTPLAALQSAGRAVAFAVDVESYPNGAYVVAIGGEAASGPAGWVYRVRSGGNETYPSVAADLHVLRGNDTVTWHWTDRPIDEGTAPT